MHKKIALNTVLAYLAISVNQSYALEQDLPSLSLEELLNVRVSSSSFFDQTSINSTGSAWVFTQDELVDSPIIFLKDVFEFYAPASAVGFSSFTGAAIGARGIAVSDNDKTLFMVDGQNLNQVSLYGYQAGMQSTLLGDIDYIEVVNGPGGILHGSGAINNIINVMPKNGYDYKGLQASAAYGPLDSLSKLELGYGTGYGKNRNVYIYGGVAQAEGFLPRSYLELGENAPPQIDGYRRVYEIPENYRFSGYLTHDDIEFQIQFQRIKRSFNKASTTDLADTWRGHWQTYWASRLKYNLHFSSQSRMELSIPLEFFDHGVKLNADEGEKGGRESHTGFKSIYFQQWSEHKLAFGAAINYRNFDAQKQYFESDKQYLEESLTGDLNKQELFAEDIWQISPALSASLGVRYDQIDYGTFYEPEAGVYIKPKAMSAWTKRIATVYEVNAHQTIKAAYQEGFRYPDVSYFLTHGLANNALVNEGLEPLPELKEETVKSFEVSYLQSTLNYSASWELNFYYNIHRNTLSWVRYSEEMLGTQRYNVAREGIGFGPGAYANGDGQFKAYGAEVLGNWAPIKNIRIRGSYAYARPQNVPENINTIMNLANQENRWANYPEHMFKASINWSIADSTKINFTTYYSPAVNICTTACDTQVSDSQRFHQQDRLRFNTSIKYEFNRTSNISLVVQNAFENNGPPVGYDTPSGTAREGGLGDDSRRVYLVFSSDI